LDTDMADDTLVNGVLGELELTTLLPPVIKLAKTIGGKIGQDVM